MLLASQHQHHPSWRGTASRGVGGKHQLEIFAYISKSWCTLEAPSQEVLRNCVAVHTQFCWSLNTKRNFIVSSYKSYMSPLTYINWHGALCPLSLTETHSNAREGHGGGHASLLWGQKKGPGPPSLPHTVLLTSISFLRLLLFSSDFCVLLVIIA